MRSKDLIQPNRKNNQILYFNKLDFIHKEKVRSKMVIGTYMPITKRDTHFVDVAYNESQNSQMLMKHGACVVENNTIIGRGCNSTRTKFKENFIGVSCSCHAEMNALYKAVKHKHQHQHQYYTVPRKKKSQCVLCPKGNKVY